MLNAHVAHVTEYRRPVFTCEMLTFCEQTRRAVRAELYVELAEFNGQTDHVHLLVSYPPTLANSALVQRLNGRTRMRGHNKSLSYFADSCGGAPLSIIEQYAGGQPRPL